MSAVPAPLCDPTSPSYPKWTTFDLLAWKIWPERWRGGTQYLFAYKDGWVAYNRLRIVAAAGQAGIPADLLAGVAWEEAGGDPDFTDMPKVRIREFDWSGPDFVDRHLTITKPPEDTSLGSISIQLRAAAHELGLNPETLDHQRRMNLAQCLETDAFNIEVVARHLRRLVAHDYPHANPMALTDEQFAIAGSRYNRGTRRALGDYEASFRAAPGSPGREYTEYGRAMLRRRARVAALLRPTAPKP